MSSQERLDENLRKAISELVNFHHSNIDGVWKEEAISVARGRVIRKSHELVYLVELQSPET